MSGYTYYFRSHRVIVFLVFVSVVIALSFAIPHKVINQSNTPVFDPAADKAFLDAYARDAEVNQGITLLRAPLLTPIDGTNPTPNDISLIILNHSEEEILFSDQGFGLRTFVFDNITNTWNEIYIQKPFSQLVILPPKLERFDYSINNMWSIPDRDFNKFPNEGIRIYMSGTGNETEKTYGAYYDFRLVR